MSEESDNMTKEGVKPQRKPRAEPKRTRRNYYKRELIALQSRVDMALRLMKKVKINPGHGESLIDIAVDFLEGKQGGDN